MGAALKKPKELRRAGLRGDVSERVYQALRSGIIDGSIAPGQRLVELAICDWLQISRTPAREALRRLQSSGLVEQSPGGGLQVVSYDVNALHELYVMREMLEGCAAAEAARNATAAERDNLHASIREQQDVATDIHSFAQANQVFHAHLYNAAHNRFLLRTLQALHDSVMLLGPTAINTPEWVQIAIGQHSEIVDAIAAGDADRAADIMRQHIREGFERRKLVLQRRTAPSAARRAA